MVLWSVWSAVVAFGAGLSMWAIYIPPVTRFLGRTVTSTGVHEEYSLVVHSQSELILIFVAAFLLWAVGMIVIAIWKNGRVTEWDSHGIGCAICLQVGLDAMALFNQGVKPAAIRTAIDKKYASSFPSSTPTPRPSK